MKLHFYTPDTQKSTSLPLFSATVKAGFPSPAEDFIEKRLDLNELIIKHRAATFFVKVEGNSMIDANIKDGDILVVDRALQAGDGKICIAILNGEFTVKRLKIKEDSIALLPENPNYPILPITPDMQFEVWGVVTYIIHKCSF